MNQLILTFEGLENCVNFKKLHCKNNQLTSLEGLENCVNLKELNWKNNHLTSLEGLEKCINLKELNCKNNFFLLNKFLHNPLNQSWAKDLSQDWCLNLR